MILPFRVLHPKEASPRLKARVDEYQLGGRGVETFFDLIEVDESRDPAQTRPF